MKIDRALQRTLLKRLADEYPAQVDVQNWDNELGAASDNLAYLEQHGLCTVRRSGSIGERRPKAQYSTATARGIDFLTDDGGLSAILGVVTIKLHDDTIKALIEAKIVHSDLPEPEKKRYLDQLRELPAETTKHLVLKLVDLGLEKGPAAISTIGTFLTGLKALA